MKRFASKSWCTPTRSAPRRPRLGRSAAVARRMIVAFGETGDVTGDGCEHVNAPRGGDAHRNEARAHRRVHLTGLLTLISSPSPMPGDLIRALRCDT